MVVNHEPLWTFAVWDAEAGCYRQAGMYLTRDSAELARERTPWSWGAHSPVYDIPQPWPGGLPPRAAKTGE